jgi:hypothetical protein
VHKLGQGVLQGGLQTLLFHLGGMHKPSPNMKEDIEFQKGLTVKQIRALLGLLGPLKQLLPDIDFFCEFA